MSNIPWSIKRNLENSLAEFLQNAITNDSLTVIDSKGSEKTIEVRVGKEFNSNWTLPVIALYYDSHQSPRLSIGSNLREKTHLMIIDIRALDEGMQQDLADWVETTINDGFIFYTYSPNSSDPDNPDKDETAYCSLEFLSNVPVNIGDTADLPDKYRQNITISVFLE